MTTTRPTTNLAMAMRLPATDPHSILHANIWARPEREPAYLQTEKLETPVEGHLDQVEESSYQVLDLGVAVTIFPAEKSQMLVREDYEELRQMIEKDRHTLGRQLGGMVVTGHPGIGKSFFLFYYLFKNLLAAQPTALQTDKNSFLLFIEDGVYLIRFSSNTAIYDIQSQLRNLGCKNGIVALVDTSEKVPSPAHVFTDGRLPFYVIQSAAPRASYWNNWLGQHSGSVVVMKPCSWSEIYIIGTDFCTREFTANDLFYVFQEYGPSVRLCLDLAGDERRIKLYDFELRARLSSGDFLMAAKSYRLFKNPEVEQLESILLMIPDILRLPLVTITSRAIASFFKGRDIFRLLDSETETQERGRDIWEFVIKERFLITRGLFFCSDTQIGSARPETPGYYLTNSGCLLPPLSTGSNFQRMFLWSCENIGIDACYSVAKTDAQTLLFHICRDPTATINVEELDLLDTRLRSFRNWNTNGAWKLIFVVPPSMKDSFTIRPFVGDSTSKAEWESEEKLIQCVAGMDIPNDW